MCPCTWRHRDWNFNCSTSNVSPSSALGICFRGAQHRGPSVYAGRKKIASAPSTFQLQRLLPGVYRLCRNTQPTAVRISSMSVHHSFLVVQKLPDILQYKYNASYIDDSRN